MSNESGKVDQSDSLVRPYRRPEYSLKRNCQCNQSKGCLRCLIFDNNKKGAGIVVFIKYFIDFVMTMKKIKTGKYLATFDCTIALDRIMETRKCGPAYWEIIGNARIINPPKSTSLNKKNAWENVIRIHLFLSGYG